MRKSQQYQEEKRRQEAEKNAPKAEVIQEIIPEKQPKRPA